MRLFHDTESGEIITESALMAEFETLKAEDPETYDYDFPAYVRNCTAGNGFLMEV